MPRPRLAVLSRNLPPLMGGMERLAWHVLAALATDFDVHAIGPRGSRRHLPEGVRGHACRGLGAGGYLSEAAVISVLRALCLPKPDLILATSGLTAPLARLYAALTRRPYVVMAHGLDLVADSKTYQRLFVPSFAAAHRVIANSANTRALAIDNGVAPARLCVIHPGVEWPARPGDGHAWRMARTFGDRPLLLIAGRQTRRKGLAEFLEQCMPAILMDHPDTLLLVVGGTAHHAIRQEQHVGDQVHAVIARNRLAHAVCMLGSLSDAELAQVYAAADVHVFPLIPVRGDVEGFGMVAVEAAAQGTTTVAFDEGGVRDALVVGVTGELLQRGDYAGFTRAILRRLETRADPNLRAACHRAAERYAWPGHAALWRQMLGELLGH